MEIISKRKIYFSFSAILVILSIFGLFTWGLNLGIDFTGGSLLEVEYTQKRPSIDKIKNELKDFNLGDINVQPIGEKGILLRFKNVDEETHQKILKKIAGETKIVEKKEGEEIKEKNKEGNLLIEKRFDSIGPVIGNELKEKTFYAIIIALIMIIVFIAWAFRHVSRPISSWKYGIIAIIALFHDILITMGVFAFLGKFYNTEVNAPFVAALLTILGYSVNDTIVIFDRVRENLKHYDYKFENTVNKSVNQNILRSFYTSLTTLLVLLSLYFFGGETTKNFVLALIIGVVIGTYSSIFLASPLLVVWEKINRK